MKEAEEMYCVGVDVGTSSVRAALVSTDGRPLKIHTQAITVANPLLDFYEQDSEQIWDAVCACVKGVTQNVADKSLVRGLGFDATCSMVVLGYDFQPVCVSPSTGKDRFNIIMWMDHRASKEADYINSYPHKVLEYVGGKLSPEMQTPKLLWLKKHMPDTWKRAGHFFDLPDYLTFKATGSVSRSLCSLVCKWTYMSGQDGSGRESQSGGWNEEYFRAIGLGDLADEGWSRIGQEVKGPGEMCGRLTPAAARMMGLNPSTAVGTSIIDAHAGCLAMVAAGLESGQELTGRLGLVCGTSTCHMALSVCPLKVSGVWGPYGGVVLPNTYLTEGGISATGALIDHIIDGHPSTGVIDKEKSTIFKRLEEILQEEGKRRRLESPSLLTPHLHVYPDYHGNRSPLADMHMTGMISGLTLDTSEENLAFMYMAAIQGLTYSTRQILMHMEEAGHIIKDVLMCGGLCASETFIQTHADALGLEVLIPQHQPSVLVGAAMLGATASGYYPNLEAAAKAMGGPVKRWRPQEELKEFHNKKFAVFLKMQDNQKQYREIMNVQLDK